MENSEITKVEFYVEGEGGVVAIFPEIKDGIFFTCYSHIGQHSLAHPDYVKGLKKATPEQYADLKNELVNLIGYKFE